MRNTTLTIGSIITVVLASCGSSSSVSSIDTSSLGYQWSDTSAPIVANKDTIYYNVLAPKNALADDYNTMKVFTDLFDATNVNVSYENISETSYAARKTLIMANPDEYPDAIYHAGFTDKEVIQYSTRKVIVALDDYFDKMPNLSAILDLRPDLRRMLTAPDGHIYSLPKVEEMDLLAYPNLLFLNKAWVGELITLGLVDFLTAQDLVDGLDLTLAQYQTILNLFSSRDMNANSKDDELPLSFVYQNWQGNQSDLYATFGVPENINHLTVINDQVTFTASDTKWRDATDFFSHWVDDGLIDKEVFSQTQDAFLAKGKASEQRLGSFYWWESETVVTNPEDYIVLNPLIGPDGVQSIGVANNHEMTRGEFVIFSKCANPEVLLTYMDRFYDPFISAQINYGPIGIVYEEELDNNGMLVQKAIPEGMTADELRLKNSPLGCFYLSYEQWDHVVNMEPRAKLRLERLDAYAKPFVFEGATPLPNVTFTMAEINSLATIEPSLGAYIYERQTDWLLNGGVTQGQFDTFLTTLETIGLSEVLSIYQAAYDRYNASF